MRGGGSWPATAPFLARQNLGFMAPRGAARAPDKGVASPSSRPRCATKAALTAGLVGSVVGACVHRWDPGLGSWLGGNASVLSIRAPALSERCTVLSESGDGDFSSGGLVVLPLLGAKLAATRD